MADVTTTPRESDPTDEETTVISFTVPTWVVERRGMAPDVFAEWVRTAAAIERYGRGEISFGTAAALAGMSQAAFMHTLKDGGRDTFPLDLDDLDAELAYLAAHHGQDGVSG